LGRAARTRVPFDSPLVDHEGKSESGVLLGLGHERERSLILPVVGTIPIDDYAIDAAADHIADLVFNLHCVGRTVADVHVVRLSEPDHQVSVDLGRGPGIEQIMEVDLAYITGAAVAVRLAHKAVGSARIV